jgi:pimeloyl-ACP methyl ester carboxylesterase
MVGTFFKDDDFEYMMLGALGATYHKCADVGECLTTAASIEDGDYEGWYRAWLATADRVRRFAEQSAAKGHQTSAREAFLRASLTYYKNAAFFLDGTSDPSRILPTFKAHRECFDEAASRFDPPVEKVQIPYEDTTLPGYLFKVDGSGRSRPLLLLNNGSDSDAADMYLMGAAAALERGYNALAYDGPGQGAALFLQDLYFRPDWEEVVTPVVDFALGRPEVDPERIAIMGVSQAGYWVPRAVAFEHRIAAAIADPGVFDVSTSWTDHLPQNIQELLEKGENEEFDKNMEEGMRSSESLRYTLRFRMRPYGTDSPYDAFKMAEQYTLEGVAEKIRCPLLVADPENEQFWPGQSHRVYEALTSPKELVTFAAAEGADSHCEPKAHSLREQRIFDWLDETLG